MVLAIADPSESLEKTKPKAAAAEAESVFARKKSPAGEIGRASCRERV